MIDAPQIIQSAGQLAAVIHLTIPREEIRSVMGPGISELMTAVAAQGIATAGPWFSHHLRIDPGIFDFEIGVPVAAPVAGTGRVQPGQLPAATVARTIYRGDYEGLGAAWSELMEWIAAAGYRHGQELWECYLVGPEANLDPAGWRTELNRPVIL